MILRIDKLAIELPMPAHPSPNSASAVQELLGGQIRRDVDADELHVPVVQLPRP